MGSSKTKENLKEIEVNTNEEGEINYVAAEKA
jgi:hypothetical protein